jgi:hypothetical protein
MISPKAAEVPVLLELARQSEAENLPLVSADTSLKLGIRFWKPSLVKQV